MTVSAVEITEEDKWLILDPILEVKRVSDVGFLVVSINVWKLTGLAVVFMGIGLVIGRAL